NYSAGSVGIGMTSSPSARLDVRGPASGGEVTRFSNSTGGSGLSVQQGAATGNTYTNLQAYNANGAGSATLVINGSGGNVGIGTANPTVKLDVAGGFRPGSAAVVTTCDATTEGTMRYNYSTHSLQYCGGSPLSWISLNGTPVVNCQGNWGSCSKTCGSGVQTYYVTTPASGGGAACPYSNGATMACNTTPCLASGDVVPGSYINLSLSDINMVGSGPNAICASPPMSFAEGRCASGYSYVQCGCVSPTSTTPGTCSSNLYVPTVCQ
ncbi:MAG: hypothetical protein KUL82_13300, partial [Bdellovibrio sp.]|nr:hypothetical protein [Bdellovibrio sp.]